MTKKPKKAAAKKQKTSKALLCSECEKTIAAKDDALFVEEEVGRYFCSEPCIVAHFTPEIEKLEREYGRHVSANDISSEERERYAHLRWMALEQPDELWCEKTVRGDKRYTLVAEYKPDSKKIWAVSICLMLRDEPSFLYLAFVTSDRFLVDAFRKGEKQKVVRKSLETQPEISQLKNRDKEEEQEEEVQAPAAESDRLAEPWTEADSMRASILKSRGADDIAVEDFGFYHNCLEETLQEPNELWSYHQKGVKKVYYFIRYYQHDQPFWYVVMAKDTADETQIEIVDAFPTNDDAVVQLCRHGRKEVLGSKSEGTETSVPEARRNVH